MKKFAITIFSLLVISIFVIFTYSDIQKVATEIPFLRSYPEEAGAKSITLTCNYHGKDLSLSETVYTSINDFYGSEPKKRIAYYTSKDRDFVFNYKEDKKISELTDKIEKIGQENQLNPDQTLDLAACFLQSIPYDDAKAAKVLDTSGAKYSYNELVPRYPYETLYDFTGICTDKSYLGAAIFKEMGYHTSLLEFNSDKHLSIGVAVPEGFGELGTDYAIMELTGKGFLVGDIPAIKNSGFAENTIGNLPKINENNLQVLEESGKLSNATGVEIISEGKEYTRIVDRTALKVKIDDARLQLEGEKSKVLAAREQLDAAEKQVKIYENAYKSNPNRSTYDKYQDVYDSYQTAYNTANNLTASYNSLVGKYNLLIEEYKNF